MLSTDSWTTGPFYWIGGKRVEPQDSSLGTYSNISPRTGTELCKVGVSGQADVETAVTTAR